MLLALRDAKESGVEVPRDMVERALKSLAGLKNDANVYQYTKKTAAEIGLSRIDPNAREGSVGRTPVCYLARYAWGKCDLGELEWASSYFLEYRSELERVRKVTDSHYGSYGNAPYYFLYGYAHAAEGMARLKDPKRREYLGRVREDLLKIQDDDGSWLDCHPIGKNAGTGLALLTLRHCANGLEGEGQQAPED